MIPVALRSLACLVTVGALATTIAGCERPRLSDHDHPSYTDLNRRHPITVVSQTATLDVAIEPLPAGTEARVFVETTRFVRNYGYEGRGDLTIAVPRGRSGRAAQRLGQIRLAAYKSGVPSHRVRVIAKPDLYGTITMSYDRIAAVGPTCGHWGKEVSRDREATTYENFGCASQRNLAAMAANPTDLIMPAQESARGSETRANEAKNFRDGIGKGVAPASTK